MHVENKIRTFWNELRGLEEAEILRAETRIEFPQSIRSSRLRHLETTCRIRFTGHGVLHEFHAGPSHENSAVVKNLPVTRAHFRRCHPHILREIHLHEHILVGECDTW